MSGNPLQRIDPSSPWGPSPGSSLTSPNQGDMGFVAGRMMLEAYNSLPSMRDLCHSVHAVWERINSTFTFPGAAAHPLHIEPNPNKANREQAPHLDPEEKLCKLEEEYQKINNERLSKNIEYSFLCQKLKLLQKSSYDIVKKIYALLHDQNREGITHPNLLPINKISPHKNADQLRPLLKEYMRIIDEKTVWDEAQTIEQKLYAIDKEINALLYDQNQEGTIHPNPLPVSEMSPQNADQWRKLIEERRKIIDERISINSEANLLWGQVKSFDSKLNKITEKTKTMVLDDQKAKAI